VQQVHDEAQGKCIEGSHNAFSMGVQLGKGIREHLPM
jgi:hypothetical protein